MQPLDSQDMKLAKVQCYVLAYTNIMCGPQSDVTLKILHCHRHKDLLILTS